MAESVLLISETPKRKGLYINVLPPIGILSIASYLESKGVPVEVRDCYTSSVDEGDIKGAGIVGFSINISNIERSMASIGRIKSRHPGKIIVVGGPFCISAPDRMLKNENIDAVVVGEGEEALHEISQGKTWRDIKGLYFKNEGGRTVFTGPRLWIEDLDSLPFPALDKVDLKRYYSPIKKAAPISNLMSSRGCPYNCIFCFKTMGSRWRARSVGNVVDEIQWQVEELGVREICIYDDNFTMDMKRAEDVCDGILQRGIKVHLQLTNGVRVDRLSRSLLRKMKAAGFWILSLAPETGSDRTLQKIKKGFDLKRTLEVAEWCRTLRICTWSFFMIGFPWEKEEDVEKTISFAEGLDTEFTQFTRVTPLPETELYAMMQQEYNLPPVPQVDLGFFYGGVSYKHKYLSDSQLRKMIKKAYRKVYLKPKKMLRLIKTLRLRDLLSLAFYSLRTGSL